MKFNSMYSCGTVLQRPVFIMSGDDEAIPSK